MIANQISLKAFQRHQDSHLSIIEKTDLFNIEQYKERQLCTYFEYGEISTSQEPFCCEVCDPNKTEMICNDCMVNCHRQCSKEEIKEDEAKDIKKKDKVFFICECGKKKHEILKKTEIDLDRKCLFHEFDINMKRKFKYFCKTCKYSICYLCFLTCHKKKNGCLCEKAIMVKTKEDIQQCDCVHSTHSNVIAMTQIVNQMVDKEDYEDVKHIWKLQTFNNFCMTQMSASLYDQTSYLLSSFSQDAFFNKNSHTLCDRFVRLSKCIFKSQKYFYFKECFIEKYPHDKLINAITSFRIGQFEKYGNFICSLCFLFYFLHLKKDFQNIKGFCIVDSLISSPLDRILFKKLMQTKNIYNCSLYEKYFNKDRYTLDQICIDLLKTLQTAIREFTIEHLIKCFKNYFTILKIVFFCLKRFVFNMKTLVKLIDCFFVISIDIYHFIKNTISFGDKNRTEIVNFLKTVMNYITKINCGIIFNYNDLILEEMILKNDKKNDNCSFIHFDNETTKKISKIIILTSIAYGEFIIENNDINKEYIEFLNSLLEILILTNNSYFQRFNDVSFEDYAHFSIMWDTIYELKEWENRVYNPKMNENDEDNYQCKYIENNYGSTSAEEVIRKNIFNLKEEIEMNYMLYFHYKNEFQTVKHDICQILVDFCTSDCQIIFQNKSDKNMDKDKDQDQENEAKTNINNVDLQNHSNATVIDKLNATNNNNTSNHNLINSKHNDNQQQQSELYIKYVNVHKIIQTEKEIKITNSFNECLKSKLEEKYNKTMKNRIQEMYPFIALPYFQSQQGIDFLTKELILSSIDTTITKLFFMDKSNKQLEEEHAKIILTFLMILSLTRTGLRYFCLGRNFRRLIKVFSLFPKISMDFLYLMFKGMYLKGIEIKNHKKLSKIKEELLNYLDNYQVKTSNDEHLYNQLICQSLKIFNYLSYSMNINELVWLQAKLCQIVQKRKLISFENIGDVIPLYLVYVKQTTKSENENDPTIQILIEKFRYEQEKTTNQFANSILDYKRLYNNKGDLLIKMQPKVSTSEYKKSTVPLNERVMINEHFFFSFLNFINLSTFFIKKCESYYFLQEVFRLNFIQYILNKRYLKLKYRSILLSFLKTLYLTDQLNETDNSINTKKYPNSEEYFAIIQSKKNDSNNNNNECIRLYNSSCNDDDNDAIYLSNDEMNAKLDELTSLKTIINILIQEMKIMHIAIIEEKENSASILIYIREILASIKSIGDIFISFDISSHLTLWFYELVLCFLTKSEFIIKMLKFLSLSSSSETESNKVFNSQMVYEWLKEKRKENSKFNTKAFNIYNKEDIYLVLFQEIQTVYKETHLDYDFNLGNFLKQYTKANDMDFKLFSLSSSDLDYISLIKIFEEKEDDKRDDDKLPPKDNNNQGQKDQQDQYNDLIQEYSKYKKALSLYFNQFSNLTNIGFFHVVLTKSDDITIDFKYVFFNYIISMFSLINHKKNFNLTNLFIIINRILFFDYAKAQSSINHIVEIKNAVYLKNNSCDINGFDVILFEELTKVLEKTISIQIITSKNNFCFRRLKETCLLTKNIIQFIQLLGEGHNKSFQSLIVNGKKNKVTVSAYTQPNRKKSIDEYNDFSPQKETFTKRILKRKKSIDELAYNSIKQNKSIYTVLFNALDTILKTVNLIKVDSHLKLGELPYDKTIVLIRNIIDFSTEFFQGTSKEGYIDMYHRLVIAIETMRDVIKLKIPSNDLLRQKYLIIVKSNLLELICSILEEGNADDVELNSLKDVMIVFKPTEMFSELIDNFGLIFKEYKSSFGKYTLEDIEIKDTMVELYKFNSIFQLSLELRLALKIFYLLKILSEVYHRIELIELFKEFEPQYYKAKALEEEIIHSKNVYALLKKNNTNKKGDQVLYLTSITPSKSNPKKTLNSTKTALVNNLRKKELEEQTALISLAKKNFVIYSFLNELMIRIQIRNQENESNRDFSFFVIPPICFLLSNWTKVLFSENVDRDTVAKKILTLIEETDYFIYEMFYNKKHMKSFTYMSKILFNINMIYFQYINFILLFSQNISFLIRKFCLNPIPSDDKIKINIENQLICSIHFLFIAFVLFVWFKYKFNLQFRHNVMRIYKEKFIFRKNMDSFNKNSMLTETEDELLAKVGENLTIGQRVYVTISTIFGNLEVNMIIFTFFFIVFYLIYGYGLLFAIPLLFIANLNSILFGIVYSLQLRWKQLIIVLIYAYLIVYIFSLFAFYYFPELFEWNELYDLSTDSYVPSEKLCSSMIQCYLTFLSFGVRSGGGIGDAMPRLSYKSNPGYYVAGFFFVVLFHILVIWIMANLFFGIIVDTFAALREKTYRIEEDKLNICYICQITRDSAMDKNINFDNHVETIHSMWNYVYFLTYLHINNEKNFKSLETFVWSKIPQIDTSWIPIGEENNIGD